MHELTKEGKEEVGVPEFCGMILFLTPLQTGWGHTPCLSNGFEWWKPPLISSCTCSFSQHSGSKLLTRNAGSRLSGRALNRGGLFCTLRPAIPNLEWAFAPPMVVHHITICVIVHYFFFVFLYYQWMEVPKYKSGCSYLVSFVTDLWKVQKALMWPITLWI